MRFDHYRQSPFTVDTTPISQADGLFLYVLCDEVNHLTVSCTSSLATSNLLIDEVCENYIYIYIYIYHLIYIIREHNGWATATEELTHTNKHTHARARLQYIYIYSNIFKPKIMLRTIFIFMGLFK